MKPKGVLFFILSVLSGLALLMFLFPKEGIKITDSISLEFIGPEEFLSPQKQEQKDISAIVENIDIDDDTIQFAEQKPLDSAIIDNQTVYFEPKPINIDSVVQPIEFPVNNPSALDRIYSALANIGVDNQLVRIMHYGDSQIEADRITGYLRYKLQAQFGGTGPGFVPAKQAFDFKSPMEIINSEGWYRYTVFPRPDTILNHRRFGVLGSFCRFSPVIPKDTVSNNDSTFQVYDPSVYQKQQNYYTADVTFMKSQYASSNTKIYQRCRMFYGYSSTGFSVKLYDGDALISNDSLRPTNYMTVKTWTFDHTPDKLTFKFGGKDSPEIYGFAFDSYRGVAVDNIPLRGSSGTIFTKMDADLLAQMYKLLNVKLLILQFGGNTVPYMTDSSKVENYAKYFSAQLRFLRRIAPNTDILVIGPADMSTKDKDVYKTYEYLPYLVFQLKKAAFANGCAFWNMFSAMGGENSMPSWVFADPPLAGKDFVHFTVRGSKIIAKMFYNAFISGYNNYLRRK